MVLGQPEWKKYEPTYKSVLVKDPTIYKGIKPVYQVRTITTLATPDIPKISKPIGYAGLLRESYQQKLSGQYTIPSVSYDHNGMNGDDGIPSKFTSPEFWTGREEPSVPSREQFVSEGGLFGEPVGAGAEENGFFAEAKGFDWELIFLIGGIILLFIIVAVF